MNKTGEFFLSMLIIFVYYTVIDMSMITVYTNSAFGKMIKKIQGAENMKTNFIYGALCFILLAFGLNYFVVDKIDENNIVKDSAKLGIPFGLVVYGVYDLTNLATFHKYNLKTGFIDILWGGVLGFVVSLASKYTMVAIKKRENQ